MKEVWRLQQQQGGRLPQRGYAVHDSALTEERQGEERGWGSSMMRGEGMSLTEGAMWGGLVRGRGNVSVQGV